MAVSTGLGGLQQPTDSSTAESAAPAEEKILVGWMGSLTGDQAVWGQCELNTVKMLFEEINAKGGVLGKQLEVIGYDTKGDPQEAVNVAKRLTTQDKVCAILGPNASGNAIPIAPVLEEAKDSRYCYSCNKSKGYLYLTCKVKPYNSE